jgi:hypothetical protein
MTLTDAYGVPVARARRTRLAVWTTSDPPRTILQIPGFQPVATALATDCAEHTISTFSCDVAYSDAQRLRERYRPENPDHPGASQVIESSGLYSWAPRRKRFSSRCAAGGPSNA